MYSASGELGVVISEPDEEQVKDIANRLATAWYMGASAQQVESLLADRPNGPSDVDRVLLQDASTTLGVYELTQ